MPHEEILSVTVLNSWKLATSRFDKTLADLSDEQLQQQVATGKTRVLYLVGHLIATHDRMFTLLGNGERLYPELDETYLTNPDGALADPLLLDELGGAPEQQTRSA